MDILPALDIANGRALTHRKADGREDQASADPFEVARSFVAQGARWIRPLNEETTQICFLR